MALTTSQAAGASYGTTLAQLDSRNVDRYDEQLTIGASVGLAREYPMYRWKFEAGHVDIGVDIVGGRRPSRDLDIVIVALHVPKLVDIQRLLGTVGGDTAGKGDTEPSPALAVLLPGRQFFTLHARPCEQEGYVQVGPHRAADKVGKLQFRPRRFQHMTRKGRARVSHFPEHSSITCFESDLAGLEAGPAAVRAKREMQSPFGAKPYRDAGLGQRVRVALDLPERTALPELRRDRLEPFPAIEPAMSVDRKLRQCDHAMVSKNYWPVIE